MTQVVRLSTRTIGVFLTALGSSLQGMDKLAPGDRSSSAVIELLKYVLQEMESSEQTRVSQSERADLEIFLSQLQDVIEDHNPWVYESSPTDLIH